MEEDLRRTVPASPLPDSYEENSGGLVVRAVILSGEKLWRDANGDFVIDLKSVTIHRERLILDYNHNEEEVIGYIDGIETKDDQLVGVAHIDSVAPGDRAEEVISRIKLGTPYEISPTVMFGGGGMEEIPEGVTKSVNGREVTGPARLYSDTPIRGVSICPYGTDKDTGIVGLSLKITNQMEGKEKMAEEKKEEQIKAEVAEKSDFTACPDLEKMIAEFGLEKGVEYFRKGISFEDAQNDDYQQLKAARLAAEEEKPNSSTDCAATEENPEKKKTDEVSGLKAELSKLRADLTVLRAVFRRGEQEPLTAKPEPTQKKAVEDNRPAVVRYADKLWKNKG